MMCLKSPAEPKAKKRLNSVRKMVYLEAEEDSEEIIKQADTEGTIMLEGYKYDQGREELITAIVDLIGTESPTEKIQREVEI